MGCEKTLSRKIESLFQDAQEKAEVRRILETYGIEDYEKETSRVKLAILKLAGPDQNKIRKYTLMAKQDYRDVIAWAEYPRQSKKLSIPDSQKKKKIIQADREEYKTWLIT